MREFESPELKARVSLDDADRVRQINHLEEPWESAQESPLSAAIEYLREQAGVLNVSPDELRSPQEKLSFVAPAKQGVEYRLGDQKELFDSSTIVFNQTYLNVPVWRAAITLTLKHNPNRVVMASDTSEHGIGAALPRKEKIDEHRRLFALAAADRRLRVLGLEDQARFAGLAEDDEQPRTAAFVRRVLGRDVGEEAPLDDARAIRGRFFVYQYDESHRLPAHPGHTLPPEITEEEPPAPSVESGAEPPPTLTLPPVDPWIHDGEWRLVSEVTFSLTTPEYGALNWRALVDVETDSVLLLEPLVADQAGMVFIRDPITSTGVLANTPNLGNGALNPFRTSVPLPNLDAPQNGVQSLRGRFAAVTDVAAPHIPPPTRPAHTAFDYDARTDDFAAVNAYYHTDRFFALVEDLGFPIATYFSNTVFPIRVDHRDGNTINARCVGNGVNGIEFAGYALNDLSNTANPLGRACDSRVHLHELGGHGVLYKHVGHANFGFAHSAGDSLSAILHDPDSALQTNPQERFRYAPWNPVNTRRFDREVAKGWAWGGSRDDRGYESEQILCTTLFRVYRSIGGDSADLGQRRFASRMMMYLILRAISVLTPATNPRNALGFANALMTADRLNWTTEGIFGGAYSKVIRWSFEQQGLYQAAGAQQPFTRAGDPPDVDVYIDDGRRGEYPYQPDYGNNGDVWNRASADGGATHQQPVAGVTNYAYVRVKNRGTKAAQNVRVRGFHRRPSGGRVWPDDFQPLATAGLVVGTLAASDSVGKVVGPFAWVPASGAQGHDGLLMIVSADGDASNVDHFTAGELVPEWRLVPNDNNLGLRNVTIVSGAATLWTADGVATETDMASEASPLLHALGLAGQRLRAIRAVGPTLELEMEDEEEAALRLADAPLVSAEAAAAAEWGIRRHALIATAAMEKLRSQGAREAILRIFDESGEVSLGEAARWADRLRSSDRPTDPATDRFLGDPRNREHASWHYVNLPLDLDGYDRQRYPEFTRSDDVVQTILRSVESLQKPGPRARFEEIIALRWLSHLVGDVHQPIHVGCGYIKNPETDEAGLVSAPDEALGLPSDRGGGKLVLPTGANLHSFWDSQLGPDLVADALEPGSDDAIVHELVRAEPPPAVHEEADIAGRVIGWTNDSLEAARAAYQGLRITRYRPKSRDYLVEWEGEAAYRERCAPIVSQRMAAAASNLAALLDLIWPEPA